MLPNQRRAEEKFYTKADETRIPPLDVAMPSFSKSLFLAASVDVVFGFHERPDAFALLSPPFPPVRVVRRTGDGIAPGTRIELNVGGLTWVALHTVYEKNRLFVDEIVKGPFAKWIHRHEFEPVGDKTLLTDRIEFELPGGRLVNFLFAWIVKLGLRNMFSYRHRATRRAVFS